MSTLPRIDYATHPAYGAMLHPDEELGREAEAALTPLLEEARKGEQERMTRIAGGFGSNTRLGDLLVDKGSAQTQLTSAQVNAIEQALTPVLTKIKRRIEEFQAEGKPISYKAAVEYLDKDEHKEVWGAVEEAYAANGFLDIAARYYKAPTAKIRAMGPLVNVADQAWATDLFRDGAVKDPATSGFHIDSNGRCFVKAVLYLNDVGPDQGPFGYVPGSNRWEGGSEDRIARRAYDKSMFVSRSPQKRQLFISLPKHLQTKAEFGGDMLDDDKRTQALVEAEEKMLGERGRIVLFDPEGIHRGGNVRKGERRVLLITTAPRW